MEQELNDIQKLLVERLNDASRYTRQLIKKETLGANFERDIYCEIDSCLDTFYRNHSRNQWLILGGLRGVGKTVLLSQLFLSWSAKLENTNAKIFYLSLDEMAGYSATFLDLEKALESQLGGSFRFHKYPIYVFLDEVHFLEKWSINAKVWHDKCNQLFLICTGSSAVGFWTNADIARRGQIIEVQPLSFTEFVNMKAINYLSCLKMEHKGLSLSQDKNKKVLEVVHKLSSLSKLISDKFRNCLDNINQPTIFDLLLDDQLANFRKYTSLIEDLKNETMVDNFGFKTLMNQYIEHYFSLPYVVPLIKYQFGGNYSDDSFDAHELLPKDLDIRLRIRATLENIFKKDINILQSFSQKIKVIFPALLIAIANNDQTSLSSLSKKMGIQVQTLQSMLKALEDGQVITAVPPLGASFGKISKSYKYIFNSPALRQALCTLVIKDDNLQDDKIGLLRGKMLEDTVYMYFKRLLNESSLGSKIEYDSSKGGADFVIMPADGTKQKAIVVEVGYNKRSSSQVEKTLERVGSFGIVITDIDEIKANRDGNIIYLPLSFFLMI